MALGVSTRLASASTVQPVLPATTAFGDVEAGCNCDPSASVPPDALPIALAMSADSEPGTSPVWSASATLTIVGGYDPSVAMEAAASGGGPGYAGTASANGWLSYWFAVVGPAADSIPVLFSGSTEASTATTGASSDGSVLVCTDQYCGNVLYQGQIGSYAETLSLSEATPYYISMSGSVSADSTNGDSFAKLVLDPTLSAPEGYSVVYGAGLLSTTPLPAALPLFTTGLVGIGLFGWRRNRKAKEA